MRFIGNAGARRLAGRTGPSHIDEPDPFVPAFEAELLRPGVGHLAVDPIQTREPDPPISGVVGL